MRNEDFESRVMKNRVFKRQGKFWVYIVECASGTYYTGYTNNLERRLKEHNNSINGAKYTRDRRPVKLAWKRKHRRFKDAFLMERQIKKLTRLQKESLVRAPRTELSRL